MDPIDGYLSSLRPFLPTPERDDLLRELSENIRAQVEETECGLGRPLTTSEQEAIVGQLDPPLVIAARYQRDHRTLAFGPGVRQPHHRLQRARWPPRAAGAPARRTAPGSTPLGTQERSARIVAAHDLTIA